MKKWNVSYVSFRLRNVLIIFWKFSLTFFQEHWNKIDSRNRNFLSSIDRFHGWRGDGEKVEILFDLLGTIRGTWRKLNSWPIRKFFHGTNGWVTDVF